MDIQIAWDIDLLEGDILFANNDLVQDAGLSTAIYISLFTDRRAARNDILPDLDNTDRRGWWGDEVGDLPGDRIGSRLWLLEREKTTQEVLEKTKGYCEEALQWLIDDGVATKVTVTVEKQGTVETAILAIKVEIHKNDGTITALKFDNLWEGQFNAV